MWCFVAGSTDIGWLVLWVSDDAKNQAFPLLAFAIVRIDSCIQTSSRMAAAGSQSWFMDHVWFSGTPWIVTHQAHITLMRIFRQNARWVASCFTGCSLGTGFTSTGGIIRKGVAISSWAFLERIALFQNLPIDLSLQVFGWIGSWHYSKLILARRMAESLP